MGKDLTALGKAKAHRDTSYPRSAGVRPKRRWEPRGGDFGAARRTCGAGLSPRWPGQGGRGEPPAAQPSPARALASEQCRSWQEPGLGLCSFGHKHKQGKAAGWGAEGFLTHRPHASPLGIPGNREASQTPPGRKKPVVTRPPRPQVPRTGTRGKCPSAATAEGCPSTARGTGRIPREQAPGEDVVQGP